MTNENAVSIAKFVTGLRAAPLPPEVVSIAKQSLIDWFAACLGARTDAEAVLAADMVLTWRSQGGAVSADGRTGGAAPIALVNGCYAHALDFDDFHIASVHHAGGPTFAAVLALAMDRGLGGEAALRAFVAGFEVSAQMGMNGTGLALGNAGWHPTCILGHVSAAVGCAALLGLDEDKIQRALGFAANQAGGLMAAAGTIAKPFSVGKAALSGVVAAELAQRGASVPLHLFDTPPGLFGTLLQTDAPLDVSQLGAAWRILDNTFKPYSACQLTHAPIDAAGLLAPRVSAESIRSVRVSVNPFALKIAGYERPQTPLQIRFSLKHCIAMTLLGLGAAPRDFTAERVTDPQVVKLRDLVEIVPADEVARTSARIEITTEQGSTLVETVLAALGSLDRPMTAADTDRKFLDAAGDALGRDAAVMLDALRRFDEKGAMDEVAALLKASAGPPPARRITAASASR